MNKIQLLLLATSVANIASAEELRITSFETSPYSVPQEAKEVIFHDEFDAPPKQNPVYFEVTSEGDQGFAQLKDGGLEGGSMRATFEKGQVTVGTLKVLFGRNPFRNRGIRPNETFQEIYWRIYVKHETGWQGNPAKLARATCLAAPNWTQGFIAHVWGGSDNFLCIDPATGIQNNSIVTTRYNDFEHLKWLGNKNGKTPIFSETESGRWVCVESHVKLNTPGKSDGIFELWIDGKLEAAHDKLNWHGEWRDYAINAFFLENYWNDGSIKRQSRWFDNLIISTQPIGPATAARPVKLMRPQAKDATPWEVEVASDSGGREIVWRSKPIPAKSSEVTVDTENGSFGSGLPNTLVLEPKEKTYWVRVRASGQEKWSPWHSPFR